MLLREHRDELLGLLEARYEVRPDEPDRHGNESDRDIERRPEQRRVARCRRALAAHDARQHFDGEQRAADGDGPRLEDLERRRVGRRERARGGWIDRRDELRDAAVRVADGDEQDCEADDDRDALHEVRHDVGKQAARNGVDE